MSDSPSRVVPRITLALLLVLCVVALIFLRRPPETKETRTSPPPRESARESHQPEPAERPERDAPDRAPAAPGEVAMAEPEPIHLPEEIPVWFPVPPGTREFTLLDHSLRSDGLREGKVSFRVDGGMEETRAWITRRMAGHAMPPTRPDAFASADAKRKLTVSQPAEESDRWELEYSDMGEGCACPTCTGEEN